MEDLIAQLSELQHRLQCQSRVAEQTTQTGHPYEAQLTLVCLLPRAVLRNIFLYLDFVTDSPCILETCRLFNEVMQSRAFQCAQYKLHRTLAANAKAAAPQQADVAKIKQEAVASELKKYTALNTFLGSKLKPQTRKIEDLTQTFNSVNDEVVNKQIRIQKQINHKTAAKVAKFQSELQLAMESSTHTQQQLRLSNDEFEQRISRLHTELS